MGTIPKVVLSKFEELKKEYDHIYLNKILDRFYIYRVLYTSTEGQAKHVRVSKYLGRINEIGAFIKKSAGKDERQLENAIAVIKKHGLNIMKAEDAQNKNLNPETNTMLSEEEKKILTILSMNGRAKMKSIGNLIGTSPQLATRRVKGLEERYKIKYIAEINANKIGFLEFIVLIKFHNNVPKADHIKETFEKEPIVQLCATLKGDYDILLYILIEGETTKEIERIDALRANSFPSHPATWYMRSIFTTYGYIPIRAKFFDILKEKVWHRTLEDPRPKFGQLTNKEYVFLKTINYNGNKSFKDLDKENSLANGSSNYLYNKLLENKILRRITTSIENISISYYGLILMERIEIIKFEKTRSALRLNVINETSNPTNNYSQIFDLTDPDGALFIAPIYKGKTIDDKLEEFQSKIDGANFSIPAVITGILVGELVNRRFDNVYSVQYENLAKAKTLEYKAQINYTKL